MIPSYAALTDNREAVIVCSDVFIMIMSNYVYFMKQNFIYLWRKVRYNIIK